MHISEFQIENFKSFEKVTIHFNEKTNIFTGVNNAGKSTVLEAISLWQECYVKLIQRAGTSNNKLGINKGDFVFGIKAGVTISYTDIISIRSPSYEDIFYNLDRKKTVKLIAKLTSESQYLEIGFTIASVDGANYYKITLANYSKFDYKSVNDANVLKNPETAIKIFYASPLANIAPQEERQHALKIQYFKQSHVAYLAFRNRIEALYQRRNEVASPYHTFCNQLSTILLDNNGQIGFELPNSDNLNLKLLIKISSEIPKDISLVGSGTLQIIEILLNIHEQKSELNIILLDEPDSHIHRRLQTNLLSVLNASENTQIFITTHNEALIRDAQPNWIFHLEKQPVKTYYPIERDKTAKKGLLSSANAPIIQTLGSRGTGLDFINALESDLVFMVEGVNDALRIQKILSLRNNGMRKYAYWVMGNVDTIFDQLEHYKNVFSEIKNDKSLWDKTVLVFDKDFLTDNQREKLLSHIEIKMKLKKVYAWQSYNFDSTLFSNLNYLSLILQRLIRGKSSEIDTSDISDKLNGALFELVEEKKSNIEKMEDIVKGQLGKQKPKFDKLKFTNLIEDEYKLQKAIQDYLKSVCTIEDVHKIMDKNDCDAVLKKVLSAYSVDFEIEGNRDITTNLNALFEFITTSTIYDDWNFIFKI
jgi:predicted ATP-dependent endonuclease of OLD family